MAGSLTIRRDIVAAARELNARGINQGTSGNISIRSGNDMLITPSAVPYEKLKPEEIVAMPLTDEGGQWKGQGKNKHPPSSEWRMHRGILEARPDIQAVVHAHPPHATALAMARREIPACHYMAAVFGASPILCAPYVAYGTAELAGAAVAALEDRAACLLANHGVVVIGPTLARAMWLAVELEALARQYWLSLQIGGPMLLTGEEMAAIRQRIAAYGQPAPRRRGR